MNTSDLNETLPHVCTVHESMVALRASKSKVYRLCRDKKIQSVKVGRRILIPRAAIIALLTPPEVSA